VGRLEDRLRKLEEMLVLVPSIQEYLDASNREKLRALHVLAERLAPTDSTVNTYSRRETGRCSLRTRPRDASKTERSLSSGAKRRAWTRERWL
jgi:hypothetical protein